MVVARCTGVGREQSMVPNPDRLLAAHTVLRTHDVEAFHAYIAGMEGRHSRQVARDGPFLIELRHASLGRVDVGLQYSGATITVEMTRRKADAFLIQFPLTASVDLDVDGREFSVEPGAGVVLSPSQHVRRTGRPGWTIVFRVPRELMTARLEVRLGRALKGNLSFHPRIGVGAAELLGYGLLVVDAIDRGTAPANSSVASALEDTFITLLLDLQPHSQGRLIAGSDVATRTARVRSLAEHIERDLSHRFSVTGLARLAGCSTRSLQATFDELCGLSPMEYVQQRRLSAARTLLEAPHAADSVSDVALRTGFTHLARFAARSKARYGESPSQTRRRAMAHRPRPQRRPPA